MRKVIASMNMTLDGICDHTAGIADDGLHEHYNEILRNAGALIYGRVTYQLMESHWPGVVKRPTGNKSEDDFAVLIDNIPKIVFSRTLNTVTWKNSALLHGNVKEEVLKLKEQPGKDIFVGSPGMIVTLLNLDLIDEYWLCIHPVIQGSGLRLFKEINNKVSLKLINSKTLSGGHVTVAYERVKG